MTLNEINELWAEDSKIDKINLGDESIKTPSLHHKYLQIYSKEKLILAKRKAEYNTLKLEKFNFLYSGITDKKHLEWELPPQGKIIKTEIPFHLEGDKELIELGLKLAYQQEKCDSLYSIISSINNRNYAVSGAIKFRIWESGGN